MKSKKESSRSRRPWCRSGCASHGVGARRPAPHGTVTFVTIDDRINKENSPPILPTVDAAPRGGPDAAHAPLGSCRAPRAPSGHHVCPHTHRSDPSQHWLRARTPNTSTHTLGQMLQGRRKGTLCVPHTYLPALMVAVWPARVARAPPDGILRRRSDKPSSAPGCPRSVTPSLRAI